ncbi:MAG: HlyD family efflux transporter periplasmic adaptor subunit, partial [Chlamydiia bacterium]|nr:HlyD family efflux transporter periplasmic adaptor subunit [Chlamydiia bacterium]
EIFYANLLKTQADYERAQTKLDIKKELFAEESASLFEIKEAEAELATAYAEMVTARDNYNETKVIAPFDGKVSTVYVEEFELPKAGEPLIEIIDDKKLKARFLISSKTPLKLGDQIAIKLSETGKMIRATVTRLSPDIDPSSGTLKVEAEIDNKEGKLLAGMTGRAFIPKEPSNEPR